MSEEQEPREKSFKELFEHFISLEETIKEKEEEQKRMEEGMLKFSDSLDELINISGDLNNSENRRIVVNTLVKKIAEMNFKYVDYPINFVEIVKTNLLNYLDLNLKKIDRSSMTFEEINQE